MDKIPKETLNNIAYDEKTTRKFVELWNLENGYPTTEHTDKPNMRYVSNGLVTWNEYNAPTVNIKQFLEIQISLIENLESDN